MFVVENLSICRCFFLPKEEEVALDPWKSFTDVLRTKPLPHTSFVKTLRWYAHRLEADTISSALSPSDTSPCVMRIRWWLIPTWLRWRGGH